MLTLTCKRAAALLSASLEHGLPLCERLLLRLHLRFCAACARYRAQLLLLRRALRRLARRIEEQPVSDTPALTQDARARLKRNLRRGASAVPVEVADEEAR
ncbi:MAG TPA: hypothetical protein VK421_17725 [Pyrinomonadaceae bacterium]|nr:hypothetical protein [Pyrinomonadaceae bacterium]